MEGKTIAPKPKLSAGFIPQLKQGTPLCGHR